MPSRYGYILAAQLENATGLDYSVIDSDYTDKVLNANISQGERMVNTYCGRSFTGTRGQQEVGLSGKTVSTATGLANTTTYYFKINIDGGGSLEYNITTATATNYEDVLLLMNAVVEDCVFHLVSGDLRCTSFKVGTTSSIALAAGTTGTDLFATLTGWSAFDTAVAGTGDIPDAAIYVTIEIASIKMHNKLANRGYGDRERISPLWNDDFPTLLDKYVVKHVNPVRLHQMYNNDPSVNIT